MKLTIKGIQESQARNLRRIAALRPNSTFGRVIRDATIRAYRYAEAITHVDTGSLRASHRMQVQGLRGRIYLDPSARNPRSGLPVSVYGPYEHARGGSHAFYHRTVVERGPEIGKQAAYQLRNEVA